MSTGKFHSSNIQVRKCSTVVFKVYSNSSSNCCICRRNTVPFVTDVCWSWAFVYLTLLCLFNVSLILLSALPFPAAGDGITYGREERCQYSPSWSWEPGLYWWGEEVIHRPVWMDAGRQGESLIFFIFMHAIDVFIIIVNIPYEMSL